MLSELIIDFFKTLNISGYLYFIILIFSLILSIKIGMYEIKTYFCYFPILLYIVFHMIFYYNIKNVSFVSNILKLK